MVECAREVVIIDGKSTLWSCFSRFPEDAL